MNRRYIEGMALLWDAPLHAFNPTTDAALFEGVLQRRMMGFVIDLFIIMVPVGVAAILIFLFSAFSLRMNWTIFGLLAPLSAIWALLYYATTMGGPGSGTVGMQITGLEVRTWYGAPCYPELGAAHGLLFWALAAVLTPIVLVVGLFNARRQLLHDLLLGVVVVRCRPQR